MIQTKGPLWFARAINSPHGIQHSLKFWIPGCGFQILGSGLRVICKYNLDSGFKSLVDSGFLELYSVFQSPGFRIQQQQNKFPDSGFHKQNFPRFQRIWIPLYWANQQLRGWPYPNQKKGEPAKRITLLVTCQLFVSHVKGNRHLL